MKPDELAFQFAKIGQVTISLMNKLASDSVAKLVNISVWYSESLNLCAPVDVISRVAAMTTPLSVSSRVTVVVSQILP